MNLSPLYKGQVLVHELGFSPDRKTLAVESIASNSVTFVDTATNRVKHTTYIGRSPHEAFFTQDGGEVWVSVRKDASAKAADILAQNCPADQPLTPTGRLAAMEQRLSALLQAIVELRERGLHGVDSLSDEQKAQLNRLASSAACGRRRLAQGGHAPRQPRERLVIRGRRPKPLVANCKNSATLY
jgi:YVTN family beta-propeller protein